MKKILQITILFLVTSNLIAQSCTDVKELLRKRHTIKGMTYGHPYTTFDRHNKISFDSTIANIRNRIKKEKSDTNNAVFKAYQQIYENAMQTMPTDYGIITTDNADKSYLAIWAKNNAFVFLIGLDGDANPLDTPNHQTRRNQHRNNALDAFANLYDNVMPHNAGGITFYSTDDHNMQHYARSLIYWLQAYDLLKAAYEVKELRDSSRNPWGFGDADANTDGSCAPRRKLRSFARNVYTRSKDFDGLVEHATGWKKNHGIACASSLLMAAQVLNDAGVETNLFVGIWGSIWNTFGGDADVEFAPLFSPVNWNELGQKGIEENLFVGNHWWGLSKDVPVAPKKTWSDTYSPYSEGTQYTHYGILDCGIPAMIAQKNIYPGGTNEPFLYKNEIINIFNWFDKLQTEDGTVPNIDNSGLKQTGILALTGIKEFNRGINGLEQQLLVDYVAMVGGNNIPLYTNKKTSFDNMMDAGNIVLRNETKDASHTFYMLAEQGMEVDKQAGFETTHEDDDLGSFSFYAKNTKRKNESEATIPLAIDPPYLGWGKEDKTNKYWMHNTIEIDDGNSTESRYYKYPKYSFVDDGKFSKHQQFNLTFDFKNEDHTLFGSAIRRNVNAVNKDDNFYYFINDYVNVDGIGEEDYIFQYIKLNLSGNGNKDFFDTETNKYTYRKENNLHKWTYPCSGSKWSLSAHFSALHSGISGQETWENPVNTDAKGVANDAITKLTVHQPVSNTIFQSFLYPYRCKDSLPIVTKIDDKDFVSTTIMFINGLDTAKATFLGKNSVPNPSTSINDSASHFHFTRWEGNIADSVTNPFNLTAQATYKMKLNAQKAFVIHHTFGQSMYGYKYCPVSSSNIRHASINNGTYLKFRDSSLIESTLPIDATISFSGRQLYYCSIKPLSTPTNSDTVQFYLADVGRGVEMLALSSQDTVPSRYDSLTHILYVALPAKETTFWVQEKFNCVTCLFPPTWKGIDTTFEIEDEVKHTLGHKLTIKQPNGLLKLTNSSKLDFCSGVYINSLDSIIIEGPCQTKAYERKSCKGIDSLVAAYSDNSALIITAGSALVLEPGSYTYVKNGGAIYVKRNGSLIVKAGAFLQIGDSGTCGSGWGEIIAEPGSFIHIEPDAHIEYRRTAGDTTDRNLILIPTQAGLEKAFEGVYYSIKTILQTDSILPDTSLPFFTYPICGLDTTSPIINREWGYTSFGKPLATFQAKNDTLCPGEPLHIKLNRILNDGRYQIKVCRMDSILITDALGSNWVDTCIMDTIVQDTILPDPVCKEPRNAPEEWTYYFAPGTLHRVTISVWNDCELFDDTMAYIYTATPPNVEIDIPNTACEGIGTFGASLLDYHPTPVTYAIEVTEKPDTNSLKISKGILAKTYSQSYFGLLPSTLGFGDYFFKGGRTYLISLTISNNCGTTTVYDSITIPSGVSITLERPTAFAQMVSGATSVKLNGYISEADSFHWEPTYWLDTATSLTPISTPLDSITYILIAKSGTCTATDTAHIKYNRHANAGYLDTLCYDSTHYTETLIGFPYDMSLFLGMMYYYNKDAFMEYYNESNPFNNADYFRYFTHFMHDYTFHDAAIEDPCNLDLYNLFVSDVCKKTFYTKSWFKQYYKDFTLFTDPDLPALEDFKDAVDISDDLKEQLDALADGGMIDPCLSRIFQAYSNYLNDHMNEITTTWTRITDGDTTVLTTWDNYFVAVDEPLKSSKYILSVITPEVAEIDEITILIDTLLTPLFVPRMQFDSTVYFENLTTPISTATNYEWNFGDGSTNSFGVNAIHTFPAFDTSFVVCLTASNLCNSFMYCDTVWIDSLHLGGSLFTKKQSAFYETNQTLEPISKEVQSKTYNRITAEPINLYNYPNPFNNSTIIDYQIWQNYTNAELRITNVLGQTLFTQKLNKPIDKMQIDGATLSNGIYYYSIIIDGTVSQTRSMSVIH